MGIQCRGNCSFINLPKPNLGRNTFPYLTHGFCRVCYLWIPLRGGVGKHKNRCPCCSSLYALKPRLNSKKKRYIDFIEANKQ